MKLTQVCISLTLNGIIIIIIISFSPIIETSPTMSHGSPPLEGRCRTISTSSTEGESSPTQCVLCKRNGETKEFYSTHSLKVTLFL